mgnify:FL=1
MKTITVFTPTFNRAHLLPRLYDSLCKQTSGDFSWLIIDDGSSDGTQELVKQWQAEKKIEIEYHYKENGGMHTGHNVAYKRIKTELNVCIDSDDYMPKDAVEKIVRFWNDLEDKQNYSGFVGLDVTEDGAIIGTKIPEDLKRGSYLNLYKSVTGDKKFVLVTEEVNKYPLYPEYKNEKLVPLGILYIMMGEEKDFAFTNDVYCVVEYQEDGSTNSIFKQYRESPLGFAYARKIILKYDRSFASQFKTYLHLISSSIFAKDISLAFKNVNPVKSLLVLPFGLLFHGYILMKIKT